MQHVNGVEERDRPPLLVFDSRPTRQLIKTKEVSAKLRVSISWVIQHASGKCKPYLPAIRMGPGRSPLRFDPGDVENFIDGVSTHSLKARRKCRKVNSCFSACSMDGRNFDNPLGKRSHV